MKGLIRMETQTQADVDGGKVKIDDQNITVEGADSVKMCIRDRGVAFAPGGSL